jgi:hypothetical protein
MILQCKCGSMIEVFNPSLDKAFEFKCDECEAELATCPPDAIELAKVWGKHVFIISNKEAD